MKINECGIYKITNIVTGDYYIGSSDNIGLRINSHRQGLANNTHRNTHLQRAWDKYSEKAFEFSVVLLCDIENKLYYEQVLLDGLKPAYNIATCAEAVFQGRHHTEEACMKMSETRKGRHHSEETRRKIGEANKRRILSEETKRKISEAHTGKHLTEETKRKLSESRLGKHHSEETRRKMSKAQVGHIVTEETKRKISEAHKR